MSEMWGGHQQSSGIFLGSQQLPLSAVCWGGWTEGAESGASKLLPSGLGQDCFQSNAEGPDDCAGSPWVRDCRAPGAGGQGGPSAPEPGPQRKRSGPTWKPGTFSPSVQTGQACGSPLRLDCSQQALFPQCWASRLILKVARTPPSLRVRQMLFPFYGQTRRGSDRLSDFASIPQLGNGRARI